MRFSKPRVMPCLLLQNKGLVKTHKFKEPKYLGDPINAVKIFNEKEVDELILLDILTTIEGRRPDFEYLADIAAECFMPLSYGGGIRELADVKRVIGTGVEKVIVNSQAIENQQFVQEIVAFAGSSSVVVSLDVKKNWLGKYQVYTRAAKRNTGLDPVKVAVDMANIGAGEIFLNSIDRDGTRQGYDLELIRQVSQSVNIPVIASGGAGCLSDFSKAIKTAKASAVSAGSMFVLHGKHRAVLISYPSTEELTQSFALVEESNEID